jgi:hypothetical protein
MNISWQITTVSEKTVAIPTQPKLAFSPSGRPGIAYFSSITDDLRFATLNDDGTWAISIAATKPGGEPYLSLAFHLNQPAISYCHQWDSTLNRRDGTLKYARFRGSSWTVVEVGKGELNSSLAFVPLHSRPTISVHAKNRGLWYFRSGPNTSVWTGSVVDGPQESGSRAGVFSSLAYLPSGQPAIAYAGFVKEQGIAKGVTKYAFFDGAHWHLQTVGPGGDWNSLAFGPSGQPAISYAHYIDHQHYAVMFAVGTGTSWEIQTVADRAWAPSLAFTPTGEPAISYYSTLETAIKYAVFAGGAWKYFLVETSPNNEALFDYPSLAFNPLTGQPAIAYYQRLNAIVKYAVGTVS